MSEEMKPMTAGMFRLVLCGAFGTGVALAGLLTM
jgi:hypothetical protein